MRGFIRLVLPPLVPLLAAMVLAEIVVDIGLVQSFLVPPPSAVFRSFYLYGSTLFSAAAQTALAALGGFLLSTILGIATAVLLSSARWIQRVFYPYAVFFQTVPIIAIAPLLVIWIGYDVRTVIASAMIVSIFPIIANTLTGLLSTDPALCDLFKLYGATGLATLLKLRLPFALPNILTGMRIGAGLAVIGAIVGEFITGTGLGSDMLVSLQQQKTEKVFAGLLLASLLGILMFLLIDVVSRLALRNWHASEMHK